MRPRPCANEIVSERCTETPGVAVAPVVCQVPCETYQVVALGKAAYRAGYSVVLSPGMACLVKVLPPSVDTAAPCWYAAPKEPAPKPTSDWDVPGPPADRPHVFPVMESQSNTRE